jgi:hypothetical protein
MSLCASRSLACPPKPLRVLSFLFVAATSLAFASPASAQGTAPKKEAPKPGDKKGTAKTGAAAAPAATPATPATPATAAPTTPAEEPKAAAPDAEEKEKARAIYLSLDLGFSRADVGGLSDATGFDKTGANGILAGVGVGYRHGNFRFGGRFRDTSTTEFSLWSLMGEIGYGLPFRPVSPAFYVHAGYMFDVGVERGAIASSLPRTNVLTPDVDLNGVVVGGEIVASYWFTSFLRLGPFIGFDATILSRSQADLPQSLLPLSDETRAKPLFSESGSGLGYMLNIGIRGTGDIAF